MKIKLPIDNAIPSILAELSKRQNLIICAAPGAGKTTRLPPTLLEVTEKAVWVLEPRRIAAISASQQIASENGWHLGSKVGYQVRYEQNYTQETRLLFLTEALLLKKLLKDPHLTEVGCVVLDEFHERNLHTDIALAALKELQELSRPDLKIIIMSATLDTKPLSSFLENSAIFHVPGKTFPLEIRYEEKTQLLRAGPEFTQRMSKLILRALREKSGDLLCFLPGRGEIEWLKNELMHTLSEEIAVFSLHGQLSLQEQKAALEANPKRKVILSTNVAESSITVDGVQIVVDSGLARVSQIHQRTGFNSLNLVRISKASATQRAGRAARQGPGTVYRAWIPYDEQSMKEFDTAEIQRSDLSETVLFLSALGISNPEKFSWFESPPSPLLQKAIEFLRSIGARSPDGKLSNLGEQITRIPTHPRLAKLLILGAQKGYGNFSCEIAALLSEPHSRIPQTYLQQENDLWLRWEDWKKNPNRYPNLRKNIEQLRQLVKSRSAGENPAEYEKILLELMIETYPDRICRRRRSNEPQALMVGGRGVNLHNESSVKNSEFFVALEISEGRDASESLVFQAVGIPSEMVQEKILPHAAPMILIEWDMDTDRFWAIETKAWNGLPITNQHRRPAEAGEIGGKLREIAVQRWNEISNHPPLCDWIARIKFLHQYEPNYPLLSEKQISDALTLACYNETSLKRVLEKNLTIFFESQLTQKHLEALDKECPESVLVPSGNRFKILYNDNQGAQIEVRLQEIFGWKKSPVIAGKFLTLILLAPNFRPVQVTRDLESFWKNAYPEVRKEMRARYPKHSWPENPLNAVAQAKGKPRGLFSENQTKSHH